MGKVAIERLLAFYVEQHNLVMPHSAFRGATPDEVFFGHADGVEPALVADRQEARAERVAWNRALECKPPTVAEEGQEAA